MSKHHLDPIIHRLRTEASAVDELLTKKNEYFQHLGLNPDELSHMFKNGNTKPAQRIQALQEIGLLDQQFSTKVSALRTFGPISSMNHLTV